MEIEWTENEKATQYDNDLATGELNCNWTECVKIDFKRKFNHRQSFLYKGQLTVRTIRKFLIGSSLRIESRIEIESNLEASQVPILYRN